MPSSRGGDPAPVDWSALPAPADDGAADHLPGAAMADVALPSTDGTSLSPARLPGRVVIFAFPRAARPGEAPLVDDWDAIPGARGCTAQCSVFGDHHAELRAAGADRVLGLSTQGPADQRELVGRLGLPFPVLSDEALALTRAMALPTLEVAGRTLIRRLALVVDDGRVTEVFYPVFPPDRNAPDVVDWLRANPRVG